MYVCCTVTTNIISITMVTIIIVVIMLIIKRAEEAGHQSGEMNSAHSAANWKSVTPYL